MHKRASLQRSLHRAIGACCVLVFALLLAYSYRADRTDIVAGKTTLYADFLNVQGLRAGDDVTLAGILVGKITGVSLQQPSLNARVRLAIEMGVDIPTDSSAVIRSPDLSGTKVLVIEPGGDEESLLEGDSFSYTREPIETKQLIKIIVERAEGNLENLKEQGNLEEQEEQGNLENSKQELN